ncbi:MAG: sulfite exporter TauE/SafE family protein, partial [Clostridiales bacterium]|nr:sulfite exporter TauE/SafE family protein [Clostridiales bacterium]
FGFSLISLPLLSLILDIKLIVPVLVVYSLILNVVIFFSLYKHLKAKEIILMLVTGIACIPLGMQVLLFADENLLKIFVGIFIVAFSLMLFFNKHYEIKNEKLGSLITGALSGILNGSVSLSGPPIAIFMTNKGVEKQQFRANLAFYFFILNIFTMIIFFVGGILTSEVLLFSAKHVVFLLLGVIVGIRTGNKLEENVFRKLIIIVLMVLGSASFISSLNMY